MYSLDIRPDHCKAKDTAIVAKKCEYESVLKLSNGAISKYYPS